MSKETQLTILILGSGGREHAMAKACANSPLSSKVITAPGNGGMMTEFECHPANLEDPNDLVSLAQRVEADLVIIGPEVPLSLGAADALRQAGILCYGPGKKAAELEASKSFSKAFFSRHGIPTAAYASFSDLEKARAYLQDQSFPVVIKASGLAAGKGVIIAQNRPEAESTVEAMLSGTAFGESGKEVVIEEFLQGEEVSIHLIVSGDSWILLPASQDHKRVGEGDTGLNTGGMGAYAPADLFTEALKSEVIETIIEPSIQGLQKEAMNYRGTLYIGIMVTADGPKVLEYNVRFGDPETQVLLPLVADDLVGLFLTAARGESLPEKVLFHPAYAMVVVLAARGYPDSYPKGEVISLPKQLIRSAGLIHAGTRVDADNQLVSNGGRVLGAIGTGPSLKIAAAKAYEVANQVSYPSKYLRQDIGWRQLERKRRQK